MQMANKFYLFFSRWSSLILMKKSESFSNSFGIFYFFKSMLFTFNNSLSFMPNLKQASIDLGL